MARIGMVFPGQGAQYLGMGRELAENFPQAAQVFARAEEALGYDLASICFTGPQAELDRTEVTQPAILAVSVAATRVLASLDIVPDMVAGLSLGEYSALVAAGSLNLEDALRLVALRGRLMQEAVVPGEGQMAAIAWLTPSVIEEVCAQNGVEVANYNCPGQLVISGLKPGVEAASRTLAELGARVVPLAVSVPSHCRLMRPAAEKLKPVLSQIEFKPPAVPVVSNVNARENPVSDLRDILLRQMYSPVRWEQSVRYMLEKVDYLIEVGPGSVLTQLIRRVDRRRALGEVQDLASLEKVVKKVREL